MVFLDEALPKIAEDTRRLAGELIETTLTEVGERFSSRPRTDAEIERYADAMADMISAYLARLSGPASS